MMVAAATAMLALAAATAALVPSSAVAAAVAAEVAAQAAVPVPVALQDLRVIAHRGASKDFPENTVAAARAAVQLGADGCEFDVRATKDGVIVVLHDATLNRTTNAAAVDAAAAAVVGKSRAIPLASKTLAEVAAYDAGKWKSPKFAGEKVPTLRAMLGALQGTACRPVVEIKADGVEQAVVADIRAAGMAERAVVIAFSQAVVRKVRRLAPELPVAWLCEKKSIRAARGEAFADAAVRYARELGVAALDIQHGALSREFVAALHKQGVLVWAWTVNEPERMRVLLDWGVDGITTDRPALLREVLRREGLLREVLLREVLRERRR